MDQTQFSDSEEKQFDRMIREKELQLKERELQLKEGEFRRGARLNAVTVGVIVAAIGLVGNVVVSSVNAGSSLEQTKLNEAQQLELERKKAEGALIMDAMKATDINDRCRNLFLLEGLGLTDVSVRIAVVCKMATLYNSLDRAGASNGLRSENGQVKPKLVQPGATRDRWWDSPIVIWLSRISLFWFAGCLSVVFVLMVGKLWKAIP
jgi:hypothetical protein